MKTETIAGKAIINIPGWAQDFNDGLLTDDMGGSSSTYGHVPLIFRATKLRCDSLASVPTDIMRGETVAKWPFEANLWDLIWKTEASLLLTGGAYWLKRANEYGYLKDIQWLNPTTMEVSYKNQQYLFTQTGEGGGTYSADDIVYFREFTLRDDVGPGDGAAQVSINDARLLNYLSLFAGQFFKGGAMPVTLLTFDGMTDPDERTRVEGWFRRRIQGIRNAFKVLAVSQKAEMHTLTQPMKDLAFPELREQAREAIADAFGIPQTMMSDAANYATASEHRLSYWEDTVRPRAPFYANVINNQLLKKMGLTIKFNFEMMDIFQKDVNEGASAVQTLVNSGYPVGLASQVVGIELPDDWDYEKLDAEVAAEKEKARAEFAENVDKKDKEDEEKKPGKSLSDDDLSKWQRKALKRLDKGQPAQCEFESDNITSVLSASIYGALEHAETKDDIKRVFDGIWRGYP